MEKEELQNKVKELEAKVQEQSCRISSLESENEKYTQWWLNEKSKYKKAVEALKNVTALLNEN